MEDIIEPYVGPRPFERTSADRARFFGRDEEAGEILSLVTAHPVVLVYAQSGAGKTSLLNALLIPMLEMDGFDVLPPVRVRHSGRQVLEPDRIANIYAYNVLMSWARAGEHANELAQLSIAEYLKRRPRPAASDGSAAPRIAIFDQFEELFTSYPDRSADRKGFFEQVSEALGGAPPLIRRRDLKDPRALARRLVAADDPFLAYLRDQLSPATLEVLRSCGDGSVEDIALGTLTTALNHIIQSCSLYRGASGPDAPLTEEMRRTLEGTRGQDYTRRNRLLLEIAFPDAIARSLEGDLLLRVLFVMREDYIAELDSYAAILPEKLKTRFRLKRLQQESALTAVMAPLKKTGRSFAPGIADEIVDDLLKIKAETADGSLTEIKGEFVEPVQLQVVCQGLWEALRPDESVITHDHLERSGDVDEVLKKFYEKSIRRACTETGVDEGELRRWFEQKLITRSGTRGMVYAGARETEGIPNSAVDVLEDVHIIRGELRGITRWYELTHDRLIEPILKSRQDWLAEHAVGEQMRRRLEEAANAWDYADHSQTALLEEPELTEAQNWLKSPEAERLGYSVTVTAFVDASRAAIEHHQELERARAAAAAEKQRVRQMRVRIAAMAVVIVLITAMAVGLYLQNAETRILMTQTQALMSEVSRERDIARSGELATHALQKLARDPREGLRLALAAFKFSPSEEAQDVLKQAYVESFSRVTLSEHGDTVVKAILSPDGKRVFTASEDSTIRIWDVTSADTIRVLKGHGGGVYEMVLSPDGSRLATEAADGTARIWTVDGTEHPPVILHGLLGSVAALAFSPDGRLLAGESSDDDNERWEASIWDARTGNINTILRGHEDDITSVAFSPDGGLLVTTSIDKTARVWDAQTGTAGPILRGHEAAVNEARFSPDGKRILTVSDDGTARVWNANDGTQVVPLKGHTAAVGSGSFSPNQEMIVTSGRRLMPRSYMANKHLPLFDFGADLPGLADTTTGADNTGADNTARVWNSTTGDLISVLRGHAGDVYTAEFSSDGKLVVTASADGTARVWNARTGTLVMTLAHHEGPVYSAAFGPDDKLIVTASRDTRAIVWAAPARKITRELRIDRGPVLRAEASRDGGEIVTTYLNGTGAVWDVVTGNLVSTLHGDSNWVYDAAVSPDKRLMVTASRFEPSDGASASNSSLPTEHAARVWDSATGDLVAELRTLGIIRTVRFSPDGRFVITAGGEDDAQESEEDETAGAPANQAQREVNSARVWRLDTERGSRVTGARIATTLRGHQDAIYAAEFSPDGNLVVTGSSDSTARVWDLATSKSRRVSPKIDIFTAVSFDRTSRLIATGTNDGRVVVWEAITGRRVTALRAHDGGVTSVGFSPNGKLIVTASYDDEIVRVWNLESGQRLDEFRIPAEALTRAAFISDGRRVVVGGVDGIARIFECEVCGSFDDLLAMARQRAGRELTPDELKHYLHQD